MNSLLISAQLRQCVGVVGAEAEAAAAPVSDFAHIISCLPPPLSTSAALLFFSFVKASNAKLPNVTPALILVSPYSFLFLFSRSFFPLFFVVLFVLACIYIFIFCFPIDFMY